MSARQATAYTPQITVRESNPRAHLNDEELEAHRLLDLLKAGDDIPLKAVQWSLRVTGDAIGLR